MEDLEPYNRATHLERGGRTVKTPPGLLPIELS